jgi:anti-anti-sigma factor
LNAIEVHLADEGERLLARPRGRMDADSGTDFASAIELQLPPAIKSVTIDLAELEFIGLGGIRALLRLARSLKGSERKLDFAHGSEPVREALHQAGFDHLFAFTPPFASHRGTPR